MILFEKKYQTFDTVFHHQMKHLEVRQKYSAARRIFNSLLGVSSGDETLHLMFVILLEKWACSHWVNLKSNFLHFHSLCQGYVSATIFLLPVSFPCPVKFFINDNYCQISQAL